MYVPFLEYDFRGMISKSRSETDFRFWPDLGNHTPESWKSHPKGMISWGMILCGYDFLNLDRDLDDGSVEVVQCQVITPTRQRG